MDQEAVRILCKDHPSVFQSVDSTLDVAPGVVGPGASELLAEVVSATGGTLLEGSVSGPVEDEGEEKNQQDESEEKSIAVFGHSTTLSLPRLRRQGICQLLYVT